MRGVASFFQLDMAAFRKDSLAAIEMAAKVGNLRAESQALLVYSHQLPYTGDWSEAQRCAERCLELSSHLSAKQFEALAHCTLGHVLLTLGSRVEGQERIARGYALSRQVDTASVGASILAVLALHSRDAAERRWALDEGQKVLGRGAPSHNYFHFYQAAMEVALAEGAWDEAEHYAAALEDYTRCEPLPWSDFFIRRARAMLALGRGQRDTRLVATLQGLHDQAEEVGLKSALPALREALRYLPALKS
jgi:tetratricopeptide (TPR) repeat protein